MAENILKTFSKITFGVGEEKMLRNVINKIYSAKFRLGANNFVTVLSYDSKGDGKLLQSSYELLMATLEVNKRWQVLSLKYCGTSENLCKLVQGWHMWHPHVTVCPPVSSTALHRKIWRNANIKRITG